MSKEVGLSIALPLFNTRECLPSCIYPVEQVMVSDGAINHFE